MITIGCVGMTHLGLIYTTAFAAKGFKLIAYDTNEDLIVQLQKFDLSVNEPDLLNLLITNNNNIIFTSDVNQLKACDLVFIACDVPTDSMGMSDLTMIQDLIHQTLPNLSAKTCLIILSQVYPGFTRALPFAHDRLFYQVETLIFGCALERALKPERYIVGTDDPNRQLPALYLELLQAFNCPILNMRYESAELAKIAINMYLISSVTTTNMLSEICCQVGADWEEIIPALRLDKRIGQHAYLTPGLGIAGGNLERDLQTILQIGQRNDIEMAVARAWCVDSLYRRDWVLRCIKHILTTISNPTICILGLAYKANTNSIKNSPALNLIQQVTTQYNLKIHVHDPIVEYQPALANVTQYQNINDALHTSDVLIIMTSWEHYRALHIQELKNLMHGNTIIDPYRVLSSHAMYALEFNYFSLNRAQDATHTNQLKELNYV